MSNHSTGFGKKNTGRDVIFFSRITFKKTLFYSISLKFQENLWVGRGDGDHTNLLDCLVFREIFLVLLAADDDVCNFPYTFVLSALS